MKDYFNSPLPRVIAHRGFAPVGGTAVENTLAAFASALELGASHLETDVHSSKDGVAVVSHDPDLARLVSQTGTVGGLNFSTLRTLDLGNGSFFCSLAEALATFPTARFNIDIKSRDAVGPTVDAVLAADASDRVLVTSFSGARRSRAVRGLPGVATSASAARFVVALLADRIGARWIVRAALKNVDAVQVPERALGLEVVTPHFVQTLHEVGVELHVWTVNDESSMHRLLDAGVDGLITDRTDIAITVLAERA